MKIIQTIFRIGLVTSCALIFLIGTIRVGVILFSLPHIHTHAAVEPRSVARVPGAGLNRDGTPSLPLRDRVDSSVALYQEGKVSKLLMSGDNQEITYNEPEAMRQYALQQGVPDADIILDYAGRRTYDSCLRAKVIFGLDEIIVTTQAYHLHRAIFLCQSLGLEVEGVPVEQSRYNQSRYLFWNFREVFATVAAFWDVYLQAPQVVLGEPEYIFP